MNVKLEIPDILGETIQKSRRTQGIKAEEMHRLLDSSAHHYSDIENGRSKPGYNALIAIVRHLNIDPNIFFYPERNHLDESRLQMIHAIETCSEDQLAFLSAVWYALMQQNKPE